MYLSLLKPDDLQVPEKIKIVENFGYETVIDKDGNIRAEGNVIYISATPEDIMEWIGGKDIWIGSGLTGFVLRTIKKEP